METTPTVGALNEKISELIYKYCEGDGNGGIYYADKAANSIEQLILEEIGKAFEAGQHFQYFGRIGNTPTKEEYITSLTKK